MTTWFTSDTHFGHARIVELSDRPFQDVQHMNEMLIKNWNDVVAPEDFVYHLGDVALGPIEDSLALIKRLNGTKIHITGNHDRNFAGGKKSKGMTPEVWHFEYRKYGFAATRPEIKSFTIDGRDFAMSHFPYGGDHFDKDRYIEYRLADNGRVLLHGHTHSTENFSLSAKGTPQVHVGVDAWDYRPVSFDEVLGVLAENGY